MDSKIWDVTGPTICLQHSRRPIRFVTTRHCALWFSTELLPMPVWTKVEDSVYGEKSSEPFLCF